MHQYAIFGHNRATFGRWLGVAAISLTGFVASLITQYNDLASNYGIPALAGVTVTTGALYFGVHYLFNNVLWKNKNLKLADLNGVWSVTAKTLEEDGSTRYDWDGQVDIEQTWEEISISLHTSSSTSKSYTACISKVHGTRGGWRLTYSYSNEPFLGANSELNLHKGYCEIIFNKELNQATGAYFNNKGRRTFGSLNLTKEQ